MTEPTAAVEVTHTARKRLDLLGPAAEAVVEALRTELERTQQLGRRAVYSTGARRSG
ncbi:hypothetical protein ACTWJ9_18275 [Streptomyces sp. GDS52]|uniref:hypothetical protein n=1 Tax=Streptomyces sp. GDS52 TaxID=3406419 RepID=UPI003FD559F9